MEKLCESSDSRQSCRLFLSLFAALQVAPPVRRVHHAKRSFALHAAPGEAPHFFISSFQAKPEALPISPPVPQALRFMRGLRIIFLQKILNLQDENSRFIRLHP